MINDNQLQCGEPINYKRMIYKEIIYRINQVGQKLISLYCSREQEYLIYIYNPEINKNIQRIKLQSEIGDYCDYFIDDDIKILVLTTTLGKEPISKIWHLNCYQNGQQLWYVIENCEIIGIIKNYLIAIQPSTALNKYQYIVKFDYTGKVLYHKRFQPLANQQLFIAFDSTFFILLLGIIQRFWLFLMNDRRISTFFLNVCKEPYQNLNHNKNYYIFGFQQPNKTKYFVRLYSNLKQVRSFHMPKKKTYAKEADNCLFVSEDQGLRSPLYVLKLDDLKWVKLAGGYPIHYMERTKNGKFLISSYQNNVYSLTLPLMYKIIQEQ